MRQNKIQIIQIKKTTYGLSYEFNKDIEIDKHNQTEIEKHKNLSQIKIEKQEQMTLNRKIQFLNMKKSAFE